jgi:hypothetical protein
VIEASDSRYRTLCSSLAAHPLYATLRDRGALCIFMEHHVYAVWDFMSLVKALQARIAPTSVPWRPPSHPDLARMINQMVLDEESDHGLAPQSTGFASHFEGYCLAMTEIGARTDPVRRFIDSLRSSDLESAMETAGVPDAARRFVRVTLRQSREARTHELAAVLAYGRESVLPDMFESIMAGIEGRPQTTCLLKRYLQRHVALDGGEHGALAVRLVDEFCAGEPLRREQAMAAASEALNARLLFWNTIHRAIVSSRQRPRLNSPAPAGGRA